MDFFDDVTVQEAPPELPGLSQREVNVLLK